MTARTRLPHRRDGEAIAFTFGGIDYVGTVSRDEWDDHRNILGCG